MGYLFGLTKLAGEGADLVKGITGQVEQSRFKDFVKENPDWADNPDKITQAISISPQLGMGLADRSKAVADQRNARAGQRLVFLQKMDDDAHKAYTEALDKQPDSGAGGKEGGGDASIAEGLGTNYAAADKAGNDVYQQRRLQAQDLYGEGFSDKLPPVWKLDEYGQRRPGYERMLDSMREPVNLVFPDGKKVTASLLPHELTQLTRENKGLQVEKLATSSPAKEGLIGGLDPKQRAEVIGQVGDDYVKSSNNFMVADQAYRDMENLAKKPSGPMDFAMLYRFNKLLDPTSVVRESEFSAAANQGSLPAVTMNWVNKFKNGELVGETRNQFLDAAKQLYQERGKEQEALDKGLSLTQRALKLDDDAMSAIKGRVPRVQAPERAAPTGPQPDAPPIKPPPPEQQAAARSKYQATLNLARDSIAFDKAAPEAQAQAFKALKDEDLRPMAASIGKMSDAQVKALWKEQKRRGWIQ